jgi:two-component system, sensor histidine kinase and response regulator
MPAILSPETCTTTGAKPASPPRRTLLVVDDELGPRQSLLMVFKDDYHVLLADGGEKALEMANQHPVDAAILDIRMSGMSGVELLERLKRLDAAIEVIMLTAYETIETARQALKHGACDYLTKPFDLETMRSAVANAMDRRALTEQREASLRRLRELQEELGNQKIQEEIVRAKGEIYASVLHDINGPLTIISGFIDIINARIHGASTVEGESLDLIKDRLHRITRQVNNCIDISQRYLSFLRRPAQAGMTVSLRQALHDVRELLRVHPSLKQNHLSVQLPEPDIFAEINGANLIQLVLNLAINALQAAATPHQVQVTVERLNAPLSLAEFEDGPGCRFVNRDGFRNTPPLAAVTISDSGSGIRPEVLDEIFRPRTFGDYFSTKSPHGGTGLGTVIVQRFIRDAHGALHVQTRVGHGSTFTVFIPARA